MTEISVPFKIINERNCPLYKVEDCFLLTGQAVRFPTGNAARLLLVRELTGLLFRHCPRSGKWIR